MRFRDHCQEKTSGLALARSARSASKRLGVKRSAFAPCWRLVSIPGGEPLLYPHIGPLVEELIKRRKYIYLCTNALLLKQKLDEGALAPSKYLTLSVHMDGQEEHHDFAVCREGTYQVAAEAIRQAFGRRLESDPGSLILRG